MRESVIYQSILQEGRIEGAEQVTRQVVINCLKEGVSLELITQVTGLTIKQIQQIQAQAENQQE